MIFPTAEAHDGVTILYENCRKLKCAEYVRMWGSSDDWRQSMILAKRRLDLSLRAEKLWNQKREK
jgi:hypothetical protein